MKTKKISSIIVCMMITMLFPILSFGQQVIEIQVSPNVLNLNNNGTVVTIHTDIAYQFVVGSTVTLNGIEIKSWKADDRGDFVAKFNMNEVKNIDLKIDEYNTMTLVGTKIDGETFMGSMDILVINVIPSKK